ncbi:MAG TPA: chromosome partitioning protein ParB [Erwinia sp.]|uniref:ParB family protein n=1 Tax=Erwinia citreus TaxID=558 RepID=UPI000E8B2EAB|nr:ParB family protein [Erwinia sp.]HBV39922.1 chromosome partitioning protein ParB [Erwinia sp.]
MNKTFPESSTAGVESTLTRLFTLDQLRPNPDDPRKTRNPRFDYIKESIRARGLASVPIVTRDPRLPEGIWTFSDGGNTRYAILKELWEETGENRFNEILCAIKPWPGRLNCLVGHLAENEGRGSLTFIDKAFGVQNVRKIHEETVGRKATLRELSAILAKEGLPVHYSTISRMEDTLKHLFPWMPTLLTSGFKRESINQLLSLRQSAEKVWDNCCLNKGIEPVKTFADVYGGCCQKFDEPESWSQDMFLDELIGDLTDALPDDEMDYDRWLLELRDARKPMLHSEDHEQDASPQPQISVMPLVGANDEAAIHKAGTEIELIAADTPRNNELHIAEEKAPSGPSDLLDDIQIESSPVIHTEVASSEFETHTATDGQSPQPAEFTENNGAGASFWQINALQDDIEHLQSMAYRLCWDISEALGCAEDFEPASEDENAPGYRLASAENSHPAALLLAALAGTGAGTVNMELAVNLLIGTSESHPPLLNDDMTLTLFRLVRVLRRLRELQRQAAAPIYALTTEGLHNEY